MIGHKIGQYRVIERLGSGGMGSVYRASDETLGREVALKILDTTMEDSTARLRAEATALARLSHPGIATVYELIEDDTRLVMAMELVRGQTLQHLLDQVGALTPRRAAEFCMQALAVLDHAHAARIVHRDLKPGNLMVTGSGTIKVMDFGIARFDGSLHLTSAGAMLGTPAYMAPEQVLGHPIDARTDVYAMGVVFFRLLTDALPFNGETPFDMAQAQVNDLPARATELRPDLPAWVDDILMRALAKKPDDRFQSAMEFHAALARAIADAPHPAVPRDPEATEIMARPDFPQPAAAAVVSGRFESRTVWLAAGAAVVLIAGVSAAFVSLGSAPPASPTVATLSPLDTAASPAAIVPAAHVGAAPAQPRTATSDVSAAAGARPASGRSSVPTPVPLAGPVRPAALFSEVKFLTVKGSSTSASDVVVQFSDTDVSVQSRDGKAPPLVMAYQGITKATYARGRDPIWDSALSAPAGKIDVPGILGRAKHWLVLQGPDRYLILRLDGADRQNVMTAFEERSGIAIDRSAAGRND